MSGSFLQPREPRGGDCEVHGSRLAPFKIDPALKPREFVSLPFYNMTIQTLPIKSICRQASKSIMATEFDKFRLRLLGHIGMRIAV